MGEGKEGGKKNLRVYYCKENNRHMKTHLFLERRKRIIFKNM